MHHNRSSGEATTRAKSEFRSNMTNELRIGFAVALILVAGAGLMSRRAVVRQNEQSHLVSHTHEVIQQLDAIVADMYAAEDFERGYILDLKEQWAVASDSAADRVRADIVALRGLSADNIAQQRRIDSLEARVPRRLALIHAGVVARRVAGVDSANAIRHTLVGQMLIRETRAIVDRMRAEEFALLRTRGLEADAAATRAPVLVTLGALIAFGLVLLAIHRVQRELTARRRAEASTHAAHLDAERANRAKSEFLSNMSHELRTPLNSVIGFANIILKNKAGNLRPQDIAYLGRIVANGRHQLGLINGILDLSKIEAGKVELELTSVDIGSLVRETVLELEGQIQGRELQLIAEVPDGLAPLETDRAKIKQIVINLIGNALKFTEKGSVSVRVAKDERTGRPARIDVVDTGVGIPANRLDAIFEAFKQADSSTSRVFGGTGLGLTITRSLALLMGFDVKVESELGVGSTFSILLEQWNASGTYPRPAAEGENLGAQAAAEVATGNRPLLTLVIDDDADARVLLGQHLLELGCDVVSASSADEGMALARRLKPDLITLDVMMPRKNGIVALQEFKTDSALRNIPIVMISVVAEDNRARLHGAAALLDKPVTPEALEAVLKRHIHAGLIAGLRPLPAQAGAA